MSKTTNLAFQSALWRVAAITSFATFMFAPPLYSYPLDGEPDSHIRRLSGYRIAQASASGTKLPAGALLSTNDITLGLVGLDVPEFDSLPQDVMLADTLQQIFSGRDPSYATVVIDISQPDSIRWAGLRPDTRQNVGSVGKVVTMTGLFHVLREVFPDIDDRREILANTVIRGGDWVAGDEHAVPRFDSEAGINRSSRLSADDEFSLSEWVDHAVSASANGAGSVIWREAILIRHFGARYPVSWEESESFFRNTPKAQLSSLSQAIMTEPLIAAAINTENIQQGSLWTGTGKRYVPGPNSFATPRELARIMFRMEQGRLVDEWSSLEMKKYLYLTKRRYRYVYAPELNDSATFFKSGSLYSCVAEEGFRCGKYMGNGRNFMNSVVTVEYPAGPQPELRYIVSLVSNVLRFNSAWDHSRFGAAIHQAMQTPGTIRVRNEATESELRQAGD